MKKKNGYFYIEKKLFNTINSNVKFDLDKIIAINNLKKNNILL